MANLVRTPVRSAPARSGGPTPKTRVVLVRHPVKSVRASDEADRTPLVVALWVIGTLGGLGLLWALGHVGFRLGFATTMRVPHLSDAPVGGFATGIRMVLGVPEMVLEAGLANPMMLMVAFVLIAIPAAGLSAARPRRPGGPRGPVIVDVFAAIGAIVAGLNAVAIVTWFSSPLRQDLLRPLPFAPAEAAEWAEQLRVVAGFDVLAVVASALWVVLVLRLPVPLWLRALATTVCIFVLVLMTVGMAISNATAVEVHARRSLYLDDEQPDLGGRLLLGSTPRADAMLHVERHAILVELEPAGASKSVIGTQSVQTYLAERVRDDDAAP